MSSPQTEAESRSTANPSADMGHSWTIVLPWPNPPLSMNDRGHWTKRASRNAMVRDRVTKLVKDAKIPRLTHATVTLRWTVPDRAKRDTDNPMATLKPCCDGMVDRWVDRILIPGILPDDEPRYMTKRMPEIVYDRGIRKLELIIEGVIA